MDLIFRPKFYRDLGKIKDKEIIRLAFESLKQIERAKELSSIGGIKKLREYSYYYRIKITVSSKLDYRLVIAIRGNKVWAERIAPVKKIFYKQ